MKAHAKHRIDLLETYIRNSSNKLTSDAVNDLSFYSYRHANRLFKALKGESINTYANKVRIQIAAEYLKYSTKDILDIALEVGYESTAAFSKAFKKLYKQSPSSFREENHLKHTTFNSTEPYYSIQHWEALNIQTYKTAITSDSSFEDYYRHTKTTFKELNTNIQQWMLLWEEDPKLCKLPEIQYFIGIDSNAHSNPSESFEKAIIKGKYAIFNTHFLEEFDYAIWHELVYLLLDIEGKELREAAYIEWFSTKALENKNTFSPHKLAIPIQ